jgi:hypothetical protein
MIKGDNLMSDVFNTQPANLVFAGPDSGADAEPTFRVLTANDLPNSFLPASVLTSNVSTSGSGIDTYITPQFEIVSNTLYDGATFHVTLGTNDIIPFVSGAGEFSLRLGPNGNTSDPQIWSNSGNNGSSLCGTQTVEFIITVRSPGNNAIIVVRPTNQLFSGLNYFTTKDAQYSIANTNNTLYLGASFYTNNGSNVPTLWDTGIITQIA